MLVGLARSFAKQTQPKHTLMFVASGGHHGPGNGPAALVAAHPELRDNTLLILNLEHVAYADVVRGKTRAANNIGMSWELSVTESAKAVGVTVVWSGIVAFVALKVADILVGMRVPEEEEREGLDTSAHGETAYN